MESFKQQVEAVQECQSALRVPEEVVTSLSICRTALNLQQEASQLQHTAIQQCNILQVGRAVVAPDGNKNTCLPAGLDSTTKHFWIFMDHVLSAYSLLSTNAVFVLWSVRKDYKLEI